MDDALAIDAKNLHPWPVLTEIDVVNAQDTTADPPKDFTRRKLCIHSL
jgi:hypothetical protein